MAGNEANQQAWAMLAENGLDQRDLAPLLTETVADGGATVTSITPSVIGTGQVGENVRCRLTWDGGDGVPASVVIKMASSDPESRAAAELTRTYIREVGFYRDIAPSVQMRVPAVYHMSEDRPENRFVLVMEDITPAEVGNQLTGCDLAQAELGVLAAADLHGSTWGRADEFARFDWVETPTEQRAIDRAGLYAMLFPGFVDRYADRLTEQERQFGQWLADHYQTWMVSRLEAECLIHGDYRLDNMLFGTGGTAPPLTTVDWQTATLGHAMIDVAYFLSGSLAPEVLAQHEPGLLSQYRDRMAAHGIELAPDQVTEDYQMAAPAGYSMAVIASQLVGQTDRGDDMFMVMAKGSAAQALRVNTAALLA